MEPQLTRLYQAGLRSFEATIASGRSFVRAGQQCRLRLPDGSQANFTAQTDINSNRVQVLITDRGEGLAWCLSAGQVMDSRLLNYRRERPVDAIASDIVDLPLRILGWRKKPGATDSTPFEDRYDQSIVFLCGDRPEPTPILEIPSGETTNIGRLFIKSLGNSLNDWVATVTTSGPGSAENLYIIQPSGVTKKTDTSSSSRIVSFQGFGDYSAKTVSNYNNSDLFVATQRQNTLVFYGRNGESVGATFTTVNTADFLDNERVDISAVDVHTDSFTAFRQYPYEINFLPRDGTPALQTANGEIRANLTLFDPVTQTAWAPGDLVGVSLPRRENITQRDVQGSYVNGQFQDVDRRVGAAGFTNGATYDLAVLPLALLGQVEEIELRRILPGDSFLGSASFNVPYYGIANTKPALESPTIFDIDWAFRPVAYAYFPNPEFEPPLNGN